MLSQIKISKLTFCTLIISPIIGLILIYYSDKVCGLFSNFEYEYGQINSITNTTLEITYWNYNRDQKNCSLELNNNDNNYKINQGIYVCANKNICNLEFVEYTNYLLNFGLLLAIYLPSVIVIGLI